MSKWEKVKWAEVVEIKNGKNQKKVEDNTGKYPIYGSGGIMGYANDYLCDENSVVIGRKGSINKPIFVTEKFWNVDTAFGLKAKGDVLDSKYLYYFCVNFNFESLNTTVTIPSLTKSNLLNIEMCLPPIVTQKQIAKTLDTAAELLAMRKQQLAELDSLIKSVFYEMFGDPILNDKGWRVDNLINITTKVGSGATPKGGKESYQSNGISLIRSMNVHNGIFKYEQLAYINDEQANQLNSVIVEKKDVLINITGASVARSCIVPDDVLPARVNQHVSIIRLNQDIANSEYISNMFTTESYQKQLLSIAGAGGATREAITKQQLLELSVPLPPLHLQNQFATIVAKIEEQKALVKKAIEETQTLFDSLMAEYFED